MKYLLIILLITSFMCSCVKLAAIRESHEDTAQILPAQKLNNDARSKLEAVDEEMDQDVFKMRDNVSIADKNNENLYKEASEMKDLQQHSNLHEEDHFPQPIGQPRKIVKRNDVAAIPGTPLEKSDVISEIFETGTPIIHSHTEHSGVSHLDKSHISHHSGSMQTIDHRSKVIDLTHSKLEHQTKDSNLQILPGSYTTPVTVKTVKTKKKTSSKKSKGDVTIRSQSKSSVAEDSISTNADKEGVQDESPIVGMPLQTQPDLQGPYNYPFPNPYLNQYMNYPQFNPLMGAPFQNPYFQYPMYPNYRNCKKNDDQTCCGGTSINGGAQQQGSKSAFYQPINIVV